MFVLAVIRSSPLKTAGEGGGLAHDWRTEEAERWRSPREDALPLYYGSRSSYWEFARSQEDSALARAAGEAGAGVVLAGRDGVGAVCPPPRR